MNKPFTNNKSFIHLILKQKSITIYFATFLIILSCSISIPATLYKNIDFNIFEALYMPSVILIFLLYVIISGSTKCYGIYKIAQNLKKNGINYNIEYIDIEIYQESLELKSRHNAHPITLASSEKKQIQALISNDFIIIIFTYKTIGLFNNISKPLWINLNSNSAITPPKHIITINNNEIINNNNDLLINLHEKTSDFNSIRLCGNVKFD